MQTAMKKACLVSGCILICLVTFSCSKKEPKDKLPITGWHPTSQEDMAKAGFAEHPGNLNIKFYNAGTRRISDVYAEIGKFKSEPCVLEPSAQAEHLFTMCPIQEALNISFKDDQGQIHESSIGRVYKIMPKVIKGNLDVTAYIDSNSGEVTFTCEE